MFEDEYIREHMAKVIGNNMLTRTDTYGNFTMAFQATLNRIKDKTACELKNKCV